ncbi:MAG: hypothetical protein MJZ34_12030 [Paludibacteraceae bacterium]|nr:hypothetical protein [Paludibacteraceae bacterium]
MKKILYVVVTFALIFLSSCNKMNKDEYVKYEGSNFTVEYPKTWNLKMDPNHPFLVFEAMSITPYSEDSLYQNVEMATRLKRDMSLEAFVDERIEFFSQIEGFELQEKKTSGNETLIRYQISDEQSTMGTLMKIVEVGDYFYGIDCSYMNKAQQDTVDYMINSLKFK